MNKYEDSIIKSYIKNSFYKIGNYDGLTVG